VESTGPGPAGDYVGCCHCSELRVVWWAELEDGDLVVRRAREPQTTLTPLFGDAFGDDWAAIVGFPLTYSLAFDHGWEGKVDGFRPYGAGVRGLRFLQTG
jgi:hypothetical protein